MTRWNAFARSATLRQDIASDPLARTPHDESQGEPLSVDRQRLFRLSASAYFKFRKF